MTLIREICRRLLVFVVILCGCLFISQGIENYLILERGFDLHIAGPVNMFVFMYLMIKTTSLLKFERIQ